MIVPAGKAFDMVSEDLPRLALYVVGEKERKSLHADDRHAALDHKMLLRFLAPELDNRRHNLKMPTSYTLFEPVRLNCFVAAVQVDASEEGPTSSAKRLLKDC